MTTIGIHYTALLVCAILLGGSPVRAAGADPDVLWKIVNGQCAPHQQQSGDPSPCTQFDSQAGSAVLKDLKGIAQFLLIPTARVSGIESPELLAEAAPNYWAAAWAVKPAVEARLHRRLTRDQLSLAINSAYGRSQNQLHIHVDCIRPDVRDSLRRQLGGIGPQWAPLATPLAGHPYWARRIAGAELGRNDPFKLLAEGMPEAARHMERQTLVLTGANFETDGEGFLLLADQADHEKANRGHGEELQDHDCAIAPRPE